MLTGFSLAKASIVEIGDESDDLTSDALPTSARYEYSLTQQIYTSEEIDTSGTITSIAFYKTNEGFATRNIDIYFTLSSMTAFSSATDWKSNVAAEEMVFSGEVTFSQGWTTINLPRSLRVLEQAEPHRHHRRQHRRLLVRKGLFPHDERPVALHPQRRHQL